MNEIKKNHKKRVKVFIITEGGTHIGFGHITRCTSIYQAFEEEGISAKFIINGDNIVKDLLKGKNHEIFNWLNNREKLYNLIKDADIVIIDSYLATYEVYKKISEIAKIPVYIDDNKRIDYPKGIIVNGTVYAEKLGYTKKEESIYLLGSKYTAIRKEFWNVPKKEINIDIKIIMITFGGNDKRKMTYPILRLLVDNYPEIKKKIVIGEGFSDKERIRKTADKNTELIYNANAEKMKNIMLKSDIAISAAGQILYELARIGVPTITIGIADNQLNNIKGWQKAGFIDYLGIWDEKGIFEMIKLSIERLRSQSLRKRMHDNGKKFVDGKGSGRIIDFINEALNYKNKTHLANIGVRKAKIQDMYKVYRLSNEGNIRKNSFNQNKIKLEEHKEWFKNKLNDKNCLFLVAEKNSEFIGQIRFDINNECKDANISISIVKNHRGKGIGNFIIKEAIEKLKLERPKIKFVKAHVKKGNIRSRKFFERANFKFTKNVVIKNHSALEYLYRVSEGD